MAVKLQRLKENGVHYRKLNNSCNGIFFLVSFTFQSLTSFLEQHMPGLGFTEYYIIAWSSVRGLGASSAVFLL